jgi:iron complex outermembrane receptor protein
MDRIMGQSPGLTLQWFAVLSVLLSACPPTVRGTWADASRQVPRAQQSRPDGPLQLAQATPSAPPAGAQETLQPVIVTAPRVATPITEVPAAISVVEKQDIQQGQPTVGLDESLGRVPGIFAQNRFNLAQDLRLSIRGFGARAAFGIRGIKVLVDGIPETLPDGQSQVDSLDLGSTQRIEVLRGPTSALYGNASGGVINIVTEDGPSRPFVEARTTHGEYGLWKMQLKTGGQAGPLNYLFNASRLELGGYRDHSRTESVIVNGKLRLDIDDSSDLTALITVADSPRADDPGGLTQQEVDHNRRQAAPNNQRFNAGEDLTRGRFGLVYRREFLRLHDIEVTGYYTGQQFRSILPTPPPPEALPVTPPARGGVIVEFDRSVFGGGIKYIYRGPILGHRNRLTVGIDVQHQNDHRRNFRDFNDKPVQLLQDELVTNVGPYIQEEFGILDNLTLVLGGRYDYIHFAVDDLFVDNGDDTGSKTFDQLTGRFGLLYTPHPAVHLYVNIAQSFETPTTTELVNRRPLVPGTPPPGGINPDIQPQRAINYEIGVKGQALQRLSYEFAAFFIALEDELISSTVEGRTFFDNVGKSQRYGVELGLSLELLKGLRASLAYTYLHAEFVDFPKAGVDLGGNETPGLPPHQLYAELFYQHPLGFYGGIDTLYVSEFFVNDENTIKNAAYVIANLRLGYEYRLHNWALSPFFGIQNLFDEAYNGNVRINSFGDRFFEPAPEFNVYGGAAVAYRW